MQKSCFPGGRKYIETKSQWSSVSQHWDHAFENDNSFRVTTPSSNCCKLCDLLFRQKRALRFSSASTSHKSHRHITTAEVRACETKRLAANQSDRVRLNFADVPCGLFALHELFRCGVPEDNVGDLMERRFVWERGNGIHRDFAAVGEALNVALQLVKRRPRDIQRTKCRVDVKAGNRRNESVLPLGLCEHKPIRPKAEPVAGLLLGGLLLLVP